MEKILDLNKSVYELVNDDPVVRNVLLKQGLTAVTNPKAMGVMKLRTLDQVVPIRGMELDGLLKIFEEKGYRIIAKN